jgi:hypothetical protein
MNHVVGGGSLALYVHPTKEHEIEPPLEATRHVTSNYSTTTQQLFSTMPRDKCKSAICSSKKWRMSQIQH